LDMLKIGMSVMRSQGFTANIARRSSARPLKRKANFSDDLKK
jgi:hypothetical protein